MQHLNGQITGCQWHVHQYGQKNRLSNFDGPLIDIRNIPENPRIVGKSAPIVRRYTVAGRQPISHNRFKAFIFLRNKKTT
tara:strand:- start:300 stop:539 length:240 start_codon:yes stop_codon:yes gene_type:complete